jgi:hypothetical protein
MHTWFQTSFTVLGLIVLGSITAPTSVMARGSFGHIGVTGYSIGAARSVSGLAGTGARNAIPRINDAVIVGMRHGDANRPIVLGKIYYGSSVASRSQSKLPYIGVVEQQGRTMLSPTTTGSGGAVRYGRSYTGVLGQQGRVKLIQD